MSNLYIFLNFRNCIKSLIFVTFMETKDVFDLMTFLKPIWNPTEKLWLEDIDKLLTSKETEFENLDNAAKQKLGESFLQFCARTGKYHLFEVISTYLLIYQSVFILSKHSII